MLWSILIAGIPERWHAAQPLLYSLLETQSVARIPDMELIYLMDNRRRPVGAKRNVLLDAARGEYVSFIDDDDEVSLDYVQKIRSTIAATRRSDNQADVICFGQNALIGNTGAVHECTYSLAYWRDRKPEERRLLVQDATRPNVFAWTGPPAHTMAWRRALLDGVRFPETMFGEDVAFVDQACAKASVEVQIPATLYTYRFDPDGSTTR